jgi:hypothetical protein
VDSSGERIPGGLSAHAQRSGGFPAAPFGEKKMIEKQIGIRMSDGSTTKASVMRKENDLTCWLHLVGVGIDETASSSDYFEAFVEIRRKLSARKISPLCYASSRNVWPSGMARDMAQGLTAYKLIMGTHGEELVNIFETGPDVDPVTPEEQKAFSQAWLKSLK